MGKQKSEYVKPKLTLTDRIIEFLGYLMLIATWVFTLVVYGTLPETIPTHYNLSGEADAFGNKSAIITLPVVGTLTFVLLTVLKNYPSSASRLLRMVKLFIVLIFGLIVLETVRVSRGEAEGLSVWILPLTICGLIVMPIIYVVFFGRKNASDS